MSNEIVNGTNFHSSSFWDKHYLQGGTSGTGSYNHLAQFKVATVNAILQQYAIDSVIEFGCGDGNVLSMLDCKNYTGIDVSPTIISKLKTKFEGDSCKTFYTINERELYLQKKHDMALSMDVIFHLVEDDIFKNYMHDLFIASKKYIVIYSSNHEEFTRWKEFRHRNFIHFIQRCYPNWKVIQFIPNLYPYVIGEEAMTSSSDFYIFKNEVS